MSLITKIACSVTILVAAVSLTVPGIVFAGMTGDSNPNDYTQVKFDLTLDNKSNTPIQYYICTESGKLLNSAFTDYGVYPEFSSSAGSKYNYKKIPVGQKYDTGVDTNLLKTDAIGQYKVYIGPALPAQKGAFYIGSICNDSPALIKVILPSVSTPQTITITGTSNGLDSMSISSPALIANDPVKPYPPSGVVSGEARLDGLMLYPLSGNICVNNQVVPYNLMTQNNLLANENGTYTIRFPSVASNPCSDLNAPTTFNLQNNLDFIAKIASIKNVDGSYNAKEKMFLARTSPAENSGMATVIAITGGYPAYQFCIDDVVRYETGTSGSGSVQVTPGSHTVSKARYDGNMTSVCDTTTQTSVTFIEGNNTLSLSQYFESDNYSYEPEKGGFVLYNGLNSSPTSRLNIDGNIVNGKMIGNLPYYEYIGTHQVSLFADSNSNTVDSNTTTNYTFNDNLVTSRILLLDYKPTFTLSGLSAQVTENIDLNNDGTPDSQQINVATTTGDTTSNSILYAATKNNKPIVLSKKGYDYYQAQTKNKDYTSFPFGLADFTVSGVLPGETNTVDIGFMMTSTEFDTFMTDALKTRTKSNNTNERVITTADR